MSERLDFSISQQMVDRFVALSGDASSLHTDPAFGRRSPYRRNVVHGMLPLLFLPLVLPQGAGLQRLSARFLKPLFTGDPVSLETTAAGEELSFHLRHAESGALLTGGSLALSSPQGDFSAPEGSSPASGSPAAAQAERSSLPLSRLEESTRLFGDLERGAVEGFEFCIRPGHLQAYRDLIAGSGVDRAAPAGLPGWESWLAAGLVSTLVGMRLPGRYATFLDFSLAFDPAPRSGEAYRLEGEVKFKSPAAESLVLGLRMKDASGAGLASGKATVKVNAPPVEMPSIETLSREGLDLGLRGKVVLVTGASRGIGETTAKLFALHGARVVVNYLSGAGSAERVVGEIRSAGGEALALQADVGDRAAVRAMVGRVVEEFGGVDVLVNNAVRSYTPSNFLELTWEDVQKDLEVIAAGAFHCAQAVLPGMIAAGWGKIVNLGSSAVEAPPPGQASYVLAKSALAGLTRSLAVEFAPHNIQVNLVVPSMVETDLTAHIAKIYREGMKNDTPLGRGAQPLDVARAILFLASSLSSFTTGQKILVTGGQLPFL